jgi:hypothetical protein
MAANRVMASRIIVGLLLMALWLTAPLASDQPLLQAAVAYPLSVVADWSTWSGAVRESGLIACVGFALIAVGSLVRRTM